MPANTTSRKWRSAPISLDTIDSLITAFNRLKRNNGILGDEGFSLFSPYFGHTLSTPADRDSDFTCSYSRLRDLKKSGDALRSILQEIERETLLQQQKCNPLSLQAGIHSVSDDVLRYIFEIGYERFEDPLLDHTFPIAVSGVSRRFRSVALATPRIWSKLNTQCSPKQLEIFILRSKAADVSITIDQSSNDTQGCKIEDFMAIVTKHANRWSKFEYYTAGDSSEGQGYIHPALYLYPTLHLPRLTDLTCTQYDYLSPPDDTLRQHFFSKWDMPNLSFFKGQNTIIDSRMPGAPRLSECDIEIMPLEVEDWSWSFRGFLDFAPQLTKLTLMLNNMRWHETEAELPVAVLSNLLNFTLTISGIVETEFGIELFHAMKMPNLEAMTIKFTDTDGSQRRTNSNAMLRAILSGDNPFPMLKTFELDALDHSAPLFDVPQLVTSKLPSIVALSLRGSSICSSTFDWRTPNPLVALQVVMLYHCDVLDVYVVQKLLELVEESPQRNRFRLICIECYGLKTFMRERRQKSGKYLSDRDNLENFIDTSELSNEMFQSLSIFSPFEIFDICIGL